MNNEMFFMQNITYHSLIYILTALASAAGADHPYIFFFKKSENLG